MAGLDAGILLQGRGIQLPDPIALATQGVTLADLSNRGQLQQYALKQAQRSDQATQALGQILPQLQQAGFSDEAVQQALTHPLVQQNPDVAGKILETVDARRKAEADARKSNAVAFKDTTDAKAKAFTDISNAAFAEAKNPSPMGLSRVASVAKFYGLPLPEFSGNPQDPQAVGTYLQGLGNAAFAAKDQVTTAETGRHNVATEGLTNQQRIEQSRHNKAEEGIQGGQLNVARGGLQLRQQEADPFGMLGINPKPAAVGGNTTGGTAQGLTGDALLQSVPKPLADQVKALAEGRMAFPSGFALKSPYWQNMISMVAQYDPSFDSVNYNARAKTRSDFTSGNSAKSLNALNTVAGHLQTLSDAADDLKNFGGLATPLNMPVNAVQSALGDPRQKNFDIARKTVADEMTRAYRAAGGSEKDIQEWMRLLNQNGSPEQLHSNIAQVSELLESKIKALGSQYEQGMGTTSQPIQLVTPKAQETFQNLEARKSGAKPAAKTTASVAKPQLGEVRDGYLYKGGDPAKPESWEKVQ